jgi:hypothetical protein
MTRKKSHFIIGYLTVLVTLFACNGGNDPGKDGRSSQPGSGPDTLIAIFTNDDVAGSVRLSPTAMNYLRSTQGGSSGDTLLLYLAMRVCQPGSSSDTCFEIISTSFK